MGGEITAFYDRVYDHEDHFVGLQITPLLAEQYLPYVLSRLPYVQQDERGFAIKVFLFGHIPTNQRVKPDQAFGGRIYETIAGEFAIGMVIDFLSPDERRVLSRSPARWVKVRSSEAAHS